MCNVAAYDNGDGRQQVAREVAVQCRRRPSFMNASEMKDEINFLRVIHYLIYNAQLTPFKLGKELDDVL